MKCINKVILVGRAGGDAIVRETKNGQSVAHFSVATQTSWRKKDSPDEFQSNTIWHDVVAWGYLVKLVQQNIRKGSRVYIEGVLKHRTYKDEKSGQDRKVTEIELTELSVLSIPSVVENQSAAAA